MLKFHQIVLKKFFFIFSILFFMVGAIIYYWTKDFYITQSKNLLLNNIEIISFELDEDKDLDLMAKRIKENLNLRLTIISSDGLIRAESHKDKSKMDNHLYRDEIMQANKQDYGYKIRHSKTIDKDLLYVAKKYTVNKQDTYIRLSKELESINKQIITLGLKVLAVLSIFFIAILTMTYKFSKQIEEETTAITNFLTSLVKKKKSTYINSDFSFEFSNITNLLTKISQILMKKEKQKSKYTAKLQASNKQKDDIISAISHEFKNPIAVINGYSQTLLDDENLNPNIRKKFLTKIYKNGIKLSSLIDTLRLSIKLDSGQQSMNFSRINLYEMVADAVENLKLSYPKREVIIQGDTSASIQGDIALFSIVIENLIENAFKYSEDEVIISFDDTKLSVTDTGIGISKKDLENITNKFYRAHKNSWNNSLGLGLFIVNNIINLHNFSLEIQSKENEGSTFIVKF